MQPVVDSKAQMHSVVDSKARSRQYSCDCATVAVAGAEARLSWQ